jgi:hypothetical protein
MERITLEYDANNAFMRSYLDTAILAGFKVVDENAGRELTPFEKSLEDIECGRTTRIKDISNLLEECMQ